MPLSTLKAGLASRAAVAVATAVVTALASVTGTLLASGYPAVYAAVCKAALP